MRLQLADELLDEDLGTPGEIRRSLAELWWINQHLGGLSTWERLLRRVPPDAASILDVGAGTGEMLRAIVSILARRGIHLQSFALDRRPSHLAAPGEGNRLAADAFHLPFADSSIDLVACNLFLHHFHDTPERPAASQLLRSLLRVARRAVFINDLERAWPPYLFIRVLAAWRFSRITRYDGPRSVAQAYTCPELASLAQSLGCARVEAVRLFPCRLGLILWKTPPATAPPHVG